jgi:hypothetical protein
MNKGNLGIFSRLKGTLEIIQYILFYRQGNWGPERGSNVLKINTMERDDGTNLTHTRYKTIWNCDNEYLHPMQWVDPNKKKLNKKKKINTANEWQFWGYHRYTTWIRPSSVSFFLISLWCFFPTTYRHPICPYWVKMFRKFQRMCLQLYSFLQTGRQRITT